MLNRVGVSLLSPGPSWPSHVEAAQRGLAIRWLKDNGEAVRHRSSCPPASTGLITIFGYPNIPRETRQGAEQQSHKTTAISWQG